MLTRESTRMVGKRALLLSQFPVRQPSELNSLPLMDHPAMWMDGASNSNRRSVGRMNNDKPARGSEMGGWLSDASGTLGGSTSDDKVSRVRGMRGRLACATGT